MLALLHTAAPHVATFDQLAATLAPDLSLHHEVRPELLTAARAIDANTGAVALQVAAAVQQLAHNGAKVVLCTCSTIGGFAEAATRPQQVRVLRVDRPMAERAVASNRDILVVAALRSTFAPTLALIEDVAAQAHASPPVRELFCDRAWAHFEGGDGAGYIREVATRVQAAARRSDIVVLAQASMAPAEELLAQLQAPVLSSPRLGLEAAVVLSRSLGA